MSRVSCEHEALERGCSGTFTLAVDADCTVQVGTKYCY